MSSRLIYGYLIGALLLALLYFLTIPFYEKKIPVTLENAIQTQLNEKGFNWAKVAVNGRDITLSGKSPTPAAYDEVLALTKTMTAVRTVDNQLSHTLVSPYYLYVEWENQQLVIKGYLPDEKSLAAVASILESRYGKDKVVSQLSVAKGAPKDWSALTTTALENTYQLDMATIDMIDQELGLSAKTAHRVDSDRLLNALRPFESKGYTLKSNVIATDLVAMRCQKRFNELLNNTNTRITFSTGKASINASSIPLLRTLAETAQLCPGSSITITGHTDNIGSAETNLALSKQRAEAVAKWLSNSGLDETLLKTVGYGASKPISDNATEAGRAQNRRIEFTVQE